MTAVNTVIGATIIYILLQKGYGLLTLTAANAIGITIKFCNFYLLLRFKRYGGYRFSFRDVSRDTMRNLVTFGFKSFVLGIATRVRNSTDSIVIGAVIGPAAVAFYMIPANLVNQLRNFISAATLGFMPFFSELHTQNTPEKMRKAYYASSRFMVGFVVCGFVGIVFLGPNFLDVWMGPEYGREGKLILYFLAGAFVWQMLNPFHGRILTGISKHGPLAKIRMIEAAANLGLSITLAILWGKEGVALGTLIPALVVEPLILAMVCRQIDGRIADYCVQALSPSIISGVASAAFYFIAVSRFNPTGYAGIALTAILGSLVFLAVFSLTISSEERRYIFTAIKIRAGFPQQVKAR
jgi:O-antigen/teichoic acid export membrane protein